MACDVFISSYTQLEYVGVMQCLKKYKSDLSPLASLKLELNVNRDKQNTSVAAVIRETRSEWRRSFGSYPVTLFILHTALQQTAAVVLTGVYTAIVRCTVVT